MAQYYDRQSPCRTRSNMAIYGEKYGCLRFLYTQSVYDDRFTPYFSVNDRIAAYTVAMIYDRNTEPYITVKYDRKRSYRCRLQLYTKSVIVDLENY